MNADQAMDEWVTAYLEWTDVQLGGDGATQVSRISIERRRIDRRAPGSGTAREAALLEALRAESNCVRLLRQALEAAQLPAAPAG